MNGWWRALALAMVLASGCAEGGGGDTVTRGGLDGGRGPTDGSTARTDAPVTSRPDAWTPPRDAGSGCPAVCMLPNARSSCAGDRCVIDGCDPGYDDCDGDDSNGCETSLDTPERCGACDRACAYDRATAECVGGSCRMGPCDPGFGDCNGVEADGCEEALGTTTHCARCGDTCAAGSSCEGGSCSVVSCPAGQSDCDGTAGCEVDHASASNSCGSAENLGAAGGDLSCGFGCGGTSFSAFATRTGKTGRWLRARVVECSSCPADIYHCFRLEVPAGVDYDLVAYSACGTTLGSLPEGPGTAEEFCVYRADSFSGSDESFDYWLEVVHRSGSSCFDWRLTLESTSCTC